jgi:membrane protein
MVLLGPAAEYGTVDEHSVSAQRSSITQTLSTVSSRVEAVRRHSTAARIELFVRKVLDDRAMALATEIAWAVINTLLPLLLGILSIVGLVIGQSAAAAAIEQALKVVMPAQFVGTIIGWLASFQQAAGTAGLVSLGLLLFTGSNLFVTLESVFDIVHRAPERDFITQRIVSFGALFGLAGIVLVAGLGAAFGIVPGSLELGIGLIVVLTCMYWWLPNSRHSLRSSVPGAIVAAALLVLITGIFPLYVALFGQGFNIFAAFGSVLLFMFWLWIVGLVLVGGAELNAFLANPERSSAMAALSAQARTGQLDPPG